MASTNATTAGNGWSYVSSGGTWTNSNPVGFQPAVTTGNNVMRGKGPHFAAAAEPTTDNRVLTLSQVGQPALSASCSYTIRFGAVTHTAGADAPSTPLVLLIYVGTSQVGQYSTAIYPSEGYVDRGYQTYPVPAGTSGAVSFKFQFGVTGDYHDIKMYDPSVICL